MLANHYEVLIWHKGGVPLKVKLTSLDLEKLAEKVEVNDYI